MIDIIIIPLACLFATPSYPELLRTGKCEIQMCSNWEDKSAPDWEDKSATPAEKSAGSGRQVFDREAWITAYNPGDPAQTDDSPCIGASGKSVCLYLEKGIGVCALNGVPFGTKIQLENGKIYEVVDRTSKKYSGRIDLAFKDKREALEWGKRKMKYRIIK